ncbi:MAG: phenylalanine--tRNA ligase subunit alpha [Chlamydiae bacterium]|nr:phenylalanine--tRNA ligase subunit alpha [Chlamydiota bacterium]
MREKIQKLYEEFNASLTKVGGSKEVMDLRVRFLGKKGPIADLMQSLKTVDPASRPEAGKEINDLKVYITEKLDEAVVAFIEKERNERFAKEAIDVSLPGNKQFLGRIHPITQMLDRAVNILIDMGFSVQYTPEMESEFYNYEALNYLPDHPARDMQDTYYISKEILLRSHTTSFQIRAMEEYEPPIRMIAMGKCYRNETISSRSHVLFHQIDVLYIDEHVTFADLLATQEEFYSRLFDQKLKLRVRPSYFPFVEPGIEVDISCTACKGKGCRICKHSGWLEVAGAGMVHPNVLKAGGIDPKKYQGFAWGGGIERLTMLKHDIQDIRLFMENDMRFLSQFP